MDFILAIVQIYTFLFKRQTKASSLLFYNYLFVHTMYIQMKKENNEVLNIRLPKDLKENYNKHCEDNGHLLSKRVRFLLQKDIDGKLDIKK